MTWIINAFIFLIGAWIIPGVYVKSFWAAFWAAIILTLVSLVVKPFLFILTLPINIFTLGLFTFVINAIVLLIVSNIVKGFSIDGLGAALLLALLMTFVRSFLK
ncbi:MAG: phage holin family protein [Candidatus Magasanikbacteria bacterium]|nr:phage holin family protein [Candidatus Magasanikbacteria bacterium]